MSTEVNLLNGAGAAANVEFVSAYPNRALRAEDAYAAFTGDVLANLLAHCGWAVTREYYVNDGGPQADALARSICAQLLEPDSFHAPETAHIAEALKPGFPLSVLNAAEKSWLPRLKQAATDAALTAIKADLTALAVSFDTYTTDATVAADAALPKLLQSFADKGMLADASGKTLSKAPAQPQGRLYLDTPKLGDSRQRPLTGAEGRYTYFASDLAYHQHKLARGFTLLLDIFRKDYGSYGPGLSAAVELMSDGKAHLKTGLVEPVIAPIDDAAPQQAMPESVTPLKELLAFYGAQNLRRLFLAHAPGMPLEIAPDKATLRQLKADEAQHLAALALPSTPTAEALLDGYQTAIGHCLTETSAQPLMAYANTLAHALNAAGVGSEMAKASLTQSRSLLGL